MFNLLYKELRLSAHPTLYIFILLGSLVIIPSYPYSTILIYGYLAPFITFTNARENNDAFFTAMLPINKRDVVKAKYMLFVSAEIGQLIISLPFAYLRTVLTPEGNDLGLEANAAFYGFALIVYTIFNFIFFTEFYKTAYKVGKAFLLAMFPAVIAMVAIEILPHFEATKWLDSMDPAMFKYQIIILIIGILVYISGTYISCSIASKRFCKVDL